MAELNGTRLHYEVDGTGPPLLVLHGGLGLDHHIYRRTLAPLAEHFQLVFPDQRGNGRSPTEDLTSIDMPQLAEDALALAHHLGLDRFSVFGHSYGGFVAQELALRHGDRLDTLVLVDTTPGQLGDGEDETDEQGPEPPPEVVAMMSTIPATDEEMAEGMARLFPAYFHRPDLLDLPALVEGTVFRAATMVRGFEVLSSWSSVDRLGTLEVPTLVVAGRHDVFTSHPQAHRIGRRVPDSLVVVFDRSGHFPWIEEPDRFWTTLRSWYARSRRSGS
jgi:proline iminopeptidase